MIKWIKNLLGITALEKENRELRTCLRAHTNFVTNKVAELKEYTRVDADVGIRGNNTIVLTGVYKRQAYVHFYDVGDGEFERMVEHMRDLKSHCLIRHIDAPPSFKGAFNI